METVPPSDSSVTPIRPIVSKPILQWAKEKKTKRDLLCLATLANGWDFEQNEGSMDETVLNEEQFDAAVTFTLSLYESAKKEANGKKVTVLCHPNLLVGTINTRPTLAEFDQVGAQTQASDGGRDTFREALCYLYTQKLLYPKMGSKEMIRIMEELPAAFKYVLPDAMFESVGVALGKGVRRG